MQDELIVVKQLPIIEENLRAARESVNQRVNDALALACTPETYKEVKKARSELNKEYAELEARRKEVKTAILAPYERFEAVYRQYIGNLYTDADSQLKHKIGLVEDGLKAQKQEAVAAYYEEYAKSVLVDTRLVPFASAGIKVSISASVKALKEQAKAHLDRVAADLALIAKSPDKDEIMVEYWKHLNLTQAMTQVAQRREALAEESRRRQQMEAERLAREAAQTTIDEMLAEQQVSIPLSAPVSEALEEPQTEAVEEENAVESPAPASIPAQEPPRRYRATFTVTGTLDELRALKNFLNNGGYQYET